MKHLINILLLACIGISSLSAKEVNLLKAETFANKPQTLCFIENKGQVRDQYQKPRTDIDVKLDAGNGLSIFIGDGEIHYQWSKGSNQNLHDSRNNTVETYRMDVMLIGANAHAELIRDEQQEYYERYYTADLGEDGALAHTFNKITYKDIYPNIDWVLYSKNNELKYDFIVHPGGNAADIKLKYGGATVLKLEKGAVTAATPLGNITEDKPFTYDPNTKQVIVSSFALNGDMLSFNVAQHEGTVVIDPTINWGTYYGGSGEESSFGIGADAGGNSFLAGGTSSSSNIATTGAYQTMLTGTSDAFAVKFSPQGTRQWATYYGGNGDEGIWHVKSDALGCIYLGGATSSTSGVATTGAHQTVYGGGAGAGDAMLLKLGPTGARIWCTYYGGSGVEGNVTMTIDNSNNVYIYGRTESTNNIATNGAHKSTLAVSTPQFPDAFLVKFNSSGVRQWGTYFGGTGTDVEGGINCDYLGNIYITGSTESTSGIATTGSHQTVFSGSGNGFLAKFNANGVLQWGTYYGSPTGNSRTTDVACDASGNPYVVGYGGGTSGIATPGSYQPTTSVGGTFLAKFNPSGTRQWGTYYTGNASDQLTSVVVTSGGTIYTYGWTNSTTGVASTNGYQTSLGGNNDGLLVEWNNGGTPVWASYYGGANEEWNWYGGCEWSPAGYLFIVGRTKSNTGISTFNGHQTTHGGGTYDAFLASFVTDTMVYIRQPFQDTILCPGDTIKLPYGITYNFKSGNTFTAQLSNASGNFALPVSIGTKTSSVGDSIVCVIPHNTPAGNGYRIRITASNPSRTSADESIDIRIKVGPAGLNATGNTPLCEGATLNLAANGSSAFPISYNWSGPLNFSATNATNSIPNITVAHAGDYIVKANDGQCTTADTVTVAVNIIPAKPTASIDSPLCYGNTLNMTATTTTPGVTYNWTGPSGYTSTMAGPSILSATTANSGIYSVTATKAGCTSPAATATTLVYPKTPLPTVPDSAIQCVGSTLNIAAASIPGAIYSWTGPNAFASPAQNINLPLVQLFHTGYYTVIATLNGCPSEPDSVFAKINIKAKIGGYASPNDTVCAGTFMTFVAMQNNGGTSPVYQWYRNYQPITGANSLLYTSPNVTNGDKFHCTMYSVGVCDLPVTVSTDTIDMVVLPIVTRPSATITSNPATPQPNELVIFTAHVQNGGPLPKFQWQLNGIDQTGATYATWSAATLKPFDKVNVVITSNDPCTNIKTAVSDTIIVGFPTVVANIDRQEPFRLYPNPNKGSFTVKGTFNDKEVAVEVLNAIGQVIYKTQSMPHNGELKIDVGNAARGVYLLRLESENQTFSKRFNVQ